MALTIYATIDHLEQIWSPFGVEVRADDNADGAADDGIIDAVLEQGTVEVNQYLLRRYTAAVIATSTWATWANAYLSAVKLGRRRGNPIPESIADEANSYREGLQRIKDGSEHLMTDEGIATPRYDMRPAVSNLTIDGRYGRSKIRRIDTTSTGPQAADGQKRNDELYPYPY